MAVLTCCRPMLACIAVALLAAAVSSTSVLAWGGQAHRLVARIATSRLTPAADRAVRSLLDGARLADVAAWADQQEGRDPQTASWHYVNIPLDASRYDRERDCPIARSARGRSVAGPNPRWRSCVVDRILYYEERVASGALGRAERAEALKFLIHLVGDVHQPFHAIDVARGGNGLGVTAFGSTNCAPRGASPFSCTLHGVWDSTLIAHRRLNDDRYLAELERAIAQYGWSAGTGAPADWANESHALAKKALLPAGGVVDENYAREQLRIVDERLARAGLRLAALLNRRLG